LSYLRRTICNIYFIYLGLQDEKTKRVKQAKERERNQKSLAQKRSELLQEQPIVPNLANVESKLKTMMVTRDRSETHLRSEIHRKRSAKPPGKVMSLSISLFREMELFNFVLHNLFVYFTYYNSFSGII
jgi:uncharacterized protein YktB (UPF0637 family)